MSRHLAMFVCAVLAYGSLRFAALAAEAETIALMPLRTKTLDATTVAVLDDLLVAAVAERGRLKTIGQSDIGALLGLEKLKETLGCDDITCAAEIGGALGARYLLVGTVDRLGSSVVLTLSLLDTTSSRAALRQSLKVPANEDAYYEGIKDIVARFFDSANLGAGGSAGPAGAEQPAVAQGPAGAVPAAPATPPTPAIAAVLPAASSMDRPAPASRAPTAPMGQLRVESAKGGRILLDGKDTGLTTPGLLAEVTAGAHTVTVVAGSFRGSAAADVATGATTTVSVATDELMTGSVRCDSQPRGARIFLDDRELGVTPHLAKGIPAGAHEVRFESETLTSRYPVEVVADQVTEVTGAAGVGRTWGIAFGTGPVFLYDFSESDGYMGGALRATLAYRHGRYRSSVGRATLTLASQGLLDLGDGYDLVAVSLSAGQRLSLPFFSIDSFPTISAFPIELFAEGAVGVDVGTHFGAHADLRAGLRLFWLEVYANGGLLAGTQVTGAAAGVGGQLRVDF